jgi:FKBP-type peptidyl-prolyl cis-trans isomerase SlyD
MSYDSLIIENGTIVSIHYSIRDEHGTLLETSADRGPLTYIPGSRKIVEGLDRALWGHRRGDSLRVDLDPGDAYGERIAGLDDRIERAELPEGFEPKPGMRLALETGESNGSQSVWVTDVDDKYLYVDLNHPHAGKRLRFEVFVLSVAPATDEQLDLGGGMPGRIGAVS